MYDNHNSLFVISPPSIKVPIRIVLSVFMRYIKLMDNDKKSVELKPMVGVGIIILNDDNEVLMTQRISSHGKGEWSFPGGHIDFGETIVEAARREVKEETDLDIEKIRVFCIGDEMRYIKTDNKHYVNVGVVAHYEGGEPKTMEPDKCTGWKWVSMDALPDNLFEASALIIQNYKNKVIYKGNE